MVPTGPAQTGNLYYLQFVFLNYQIVHLHLQIKVTPLTIIDFAASATAVYLAVEYMMQVSTRNSST